MSSDLDRQLEEKWALLQSERRERNKAIAQAIAFLCLCVALVMVTIYTWVE